LSQIKIPTVKPELKNVILEALRLRDTSSGKDNIATGNHYQSLRLGDEHTDGFRGDRDGFLDHIDFKGKRVLDLGSNLGEISRAARMRGAAIVDGYEYDPFFVEIAQLLNAYNSTTGVSFYERDITSPETYVERYDIVLALSVFTYIHRVLKPLAEMTDEALVIETHKLDGNLEAGYIEPVTKYLPAFEVLGESDWGRVMPDSEKRAVIVFARDRETLEQVLGRRQPSHARKITVDVQRTALQRVFFAEAGDFSGEELLERAASLEIDLASVAADDDLARDVYSGRLYWQIFLKGYCQYVETRRLGPGNVYYDYIVDYYAPRRHDPGLADALRDPLFALHRIAARFRDLDQFRHSSGRYVPSPVRAFQTGDPSLDRLRLVEVGSDEPVRASRVDGWHRLFAARIFGAAKVAGEVVDAARF
jgi:SAM-dependent methyltransferase